MPLPFGGGISAFLNDLAPDSVRNAIKRSAKSDITSTSYPHQERLVRKVYERAVDEATDQTGQNAGLGHRKRFTSCYCF